MATGCDGRRDCGDAGTGHVGDDPQARREANIMKRRVLIASILSAAALILAVGVALAQAGIAMPWNNLINGGGTVNSSGGGYTLSGAVEPVAPGTSGGGSYVLNSGFFDAPPSTPVLAG